MSALMARERAAMRRFAQKLCFWGLLALVLSQGLAAQAEHVQVMLKNGQVFMGGGIVSENASNLMVRIYGDVTQTIPKAAINGYEIVKRVKAGTPIRARPQPAPAAVLTLEAQAEREKRINEFFALTGKRAETLAAVRTADAVRPEEIGELKTLLFRKAREGRKLAEGDNTFEFEGQKGSVHIEVYRQTPAAGNSSNAAPLTVALLLHGGGQNNGNWRSGADLFRGPLRKACPDLLLVCPTVLVKRYAEWGKFPFEEAYVKEIMKAVKRTWTVDPNRVYCMGYSMGGYGTWHIGAHQADTFAGLVSGAGGILLNPHLKECWGWGVLMNLAHTPIEFHHANGDEAAPIWSDQASNRILTELGRQHEGLYRHKYVEYATGGHGGATKGMGDAVTRTAALRRDPYPRRVFWEPSRPFVRQFYWLLADEPAFFTRLEASIEDNVIRLKTLDLASGFSLLLNEHLVDLAKPVKVIANDVPVFEGKVMPSLSAMLESIEDKLDEAQWFSHRIDF